MVASGCLASSVPIEISKQRRSEVPVTDQRHGKCDIQSTMPTLLKFATLVMVIHLAFFFFTLILFWNGTGEPLLRSGNFVCRTNHNPFHLSISDGLERDNPKLSIYNPEHRQILSTWLRERDPPLFGVVSASQWGESAVTVGNNWLTSVGKLWALGKATTHSLDNIRYFVRACV